MSLLDNAIGAIQIAIEDFPSNDDRRVHSAIRNLHAGILLLCKVQLQRLSPPGSDEVLLKQKVEPHTASDGTLAWQGTGKKTVDQQSIKERFGSLEIVLDWKRLEKINDIRNNTEHYFFQGTRHQAIEAFAEACVLIRELIVDVLGEDPVALIGEDMWSRLFRNKQVFDIEYGACQETLLAIHWRDAAAGVSDSISCPNCSSKLVRQRSSKNNDPDSAEFYCTSCAAVADATDIVLHAFDHLYGAEGHSAVKDGGEPPVIDCPECGQESFVVKFGSCALCDFEVPDDAQCAICGETLSAHDYSEHDGLCSYHAYVAERERDR
ncbi:hypothetical protein [Mesorhizobium sp.]|uniref:hypothetical protein n=1 Tax=Mesorhizobium sp. TaxID=1871066 RepID=UPI000FE6535B|nr:hypothetical protein [Mesorhizobium sp.]RWE85105.1 MAG: hypothetical protein EOS49_18415 [Mesorhizobium sp.]